MLKATIPLLIEIGVEIYAIATLIADAKRDGEITSSERYAIYERLGKLMLKLDVPLDFHDSVAIFDRQDAIAFDKDVTTLAGSLMADETVQAAIASAAE